MVDGWRIATELRMTGTNTGPNVLGDFGKALLGKGLDAVPLTGRSIDLPGDLRPRDPCRPGHR
jgi:hypothetical protein